MKMTIGSKSQKSNQADLPFHDRIAVIDVGSNSIRLVIYEHSGRMPIPIFNEKSLCGLGAGVAATGRLSSEAMAAAMQCLARFRLLLQELAVIRVDVFATAAIRDAINGRDFTRQVKKKLGFNISILTGGDEAKFSALGVLSAIPDANGIVGDLGGGSLELVDVAAGVAGQGATLALGPLRLEALGDIGRHDLQAHIDSNLATVPWLQAPSRRIFYAVGGAWRNLANAHMERTHYPLEILHGYELSEERLRRFLKKISRQSADDLRRLKSVSLRRQAVLPVAALVFERLLKICRPERIVFSSFGLREGRLFAEMDDAVRAQDPLLSGCGDLALRSGRAKYDVGLIFSWLKPLFPDFEDGQDRVLRAVCILSDIAWAGYSGHRGDQAFLRALHLPIGGMDHIERVLIAMALHARYAGHLESPLVHDVAALVSDDARRQMLAIGRALRLGLSLSAGKPDILSRSHFEVTSGGAVKLFYAPELAPLFTDAVARRGLYLGNAIGRQVEFIAASGGKP